MADWYFRDKSIYDTILVVREKSSVYWGCLTSGSRIFYLYGDITFGDDELQNQDMSLTSLTFEQGGISIVSQQV